MTGRSLARAARRLADQQTSRLAEVGTARIFKATVTTVRAGGASDGLALVKVTYRGSEVLVNDYPDSYTPALGHRVRCVLDADSELSILHHCVGAP